MAKRGNGEGSLYQRPDGMWIAQVDLGWVDGKRKRKYMSARTRSEAAAKMRAVQATRDAGRAVPTATPTIQRWFETYFSEVASKQVRPSTLHLYKMYVRNHVLPTLGRRRLDQLRPADLSALYNEKLRSGLSPASVRHLHAVIRRALNVAYRWQLVGINVATLVQPPSVTQKEIQPLTQEQAKVLLQAVKGDPLEARWAIGLALGLRQGEVLGLKWGDIDFEQRTLTVRRALQRQKGAGLVFTDPKTARSRRTIPLPDPLLASLRLHRIRQAEQRLLAGSMWTDSGCVFTSSVGTPIEPRTDWRAFKALLIRAELPDVRLHDLRHTAASVLLLQGVPARVVMEILGHSQISLTMNTYSHVAPELQTEAVERVGRALWG